MNLSANFKELLQSIKLPLVPKLQVASGSLDYLDVVIDKTDVQLSYLSTSRVKSLQGELPFTSKLRQQGKAGRIIKKLLPTVSDDELRGFVESLQGAVAKNHVDLFTVDGSEMYKYYFLPQSKCTVATGYGSDLRSSCYQGKARPEHFELFEKNPDKFGLLVLMVGGKMDSRCLFVKAKDRDGNEVTVAEYIISNTAKYKALMTSHILQQGWYGSSGYWICYNRSGDGALVKPVDGFTSYELVPGKQMHHWGFHFDAKTNKLCDRSHSEGTGESAYQLPKDQWAKEDEEVKVQTV